MGEVCLLGGLLVGLGLKLVSVAGCWAAGLRLGDGQGLSHTHLGLRLGCWLEQEVKAWPAWAELPGAGARQTAGVA